jgi:hypothetical protein
MTAQTAQKHQYIVSIFQPDANGALHFTFVPKSAQGTPRTKAPQFSADVRKGAAGLAIDWSGSADDPGPARAELEAEIAARMKERDAWIERVTALVDQVEQWAKELGWATRRIDKLLEDSRIGNHHVPALMMQQEIPRVLLEPIGASSLDAEGLVDLYLMPAYDDIARLYYSDGRWNLLYAMAPEAPATPLSKETFENVLAEMKRNAA